MTALADTTQEPVAADVEEGQPDPRWARPALAALLVATAAFWCIGLSRNGWANAFYSAAVQAGSKSWKAFLFGSSDGANVITVDKPPASLWPMEISARIFGVNTWSIQLPQVLLGVASVALLYLIVKKQFGPTAGLIAGTVLALTPVATLMFRFNNPDALLVFVMVASVWALLRAVSDGRTRWLLLCGALLGFGFLTKQLQVLLVVPGLGLTYLIAGPTRLRTRLLQLLAGLGSMVVAAGWWVLLVELWPASRRPYIGGSQNNSFLDLTFGYNGFGRLMGGESNTPGTGPRPEMGSGGASPFGEPGIARMFSGDAGAQISWLLPAALIVLCVGLIASWRRPRTDPHRAQYLAWGGWLVATAGVFSFMSGLFHDYYTVVLAPAVAALVGIGAVDLWQRREKTWAVIVLAATIAVTGGWAWVLLGRTPDFVGWLRWVVLAVAILAAAALAISGSPALRRPRIQLAAAMIALVVALAGPLSYSIQTLTVAHTGGVVTAGPQIPGKGIAGMSAGSTGGKSGKTNNEASKDVVAVLSANSDDFTWVAATPGSTEAGYYQLATDSPVIALGGFGSSDPAPTLEQFQDYVANGQVHYYIESTGLGLPTGMNGSDKPLAPPGSNGATEANRITDWVKKEFTPMTVDGVPLYDLTKPLAGS